MSEDLVLEILVRLPVEALLRFKTVCKAWCTIISDPSFIRMHLHHSALEHQRSFLLIVPHTLDYIIEEETWPSTFSNNIPFYRWQEGHGTNARLLHARDFHGEFGSVYSMSHRDGLVLFPTDTKVYVVNPATRDVLRLPDGQRDMLLTTYHNQPQTVGFGLDPCTNRYKVARFFYRAVDILEETYSVGMEVFTICGSDEDDQDSWRETLEDPLYPIYDYDAPAYFKGSLFWKLDNYLVKLQGFLHFHLGDETFSFVPLSASAFDDEPFHLMERGEQLHLAQHQSSQQLVIWMFCDGHCDQWIRLYSVTMLEPFNLFSAAMLHHGLFFHVNSVLYRCDMESGDVKEVVCLDRLRYRRGREGAFEYDSWENVELLNLMPYMDSLVPVTKAR